MKTQAIIGSELKNILPQRFPFLFLDRIENYELGKWATGSKNVSKREPMLLSESATEWPESFVVESLGQLAISLLNLESPDCEPPKILLGGVSGVSFHAPFPMGCKIDLRIEVDKFIEGDSFIISGHADVEREQKLTMNSLVAKIIQSN